MDISLYERIVERVHAGQNYYDAARDELRAGGYPLRPFLAWRTPVLASIMAQFPSANASRLAIAALACMALSLWIGVLKGEGPRWVRVVGGILLAAPLLVTAVPPCHLQHEAWSGVCVALFMALHARGHWNVKVEWVTVSKRKPKSHCSPDAKAGAAPWNRPRGCENHHCPGAQPLRTCLSDVSPG